MKKLYILLAAVLTFTTSAYAEIGSLSSDLVFTPVTPCRLFDTRPSQGGTGAIPAAGTKGFAVWGQTSFATQGGSNTNCGVVAAANTAAVAVNLTVVLPTTAGFITAYPSATPQPLAATVNFNAGDVKGNFAIVKVQQTGSAPSLNVYSTSAVDVVGDVVGYYSKPVATALECIAAHDNTSVVPPNSMLQFITAPYCPAGYTKTMTACSNYNSLIFRRVESTPTAISQSICYYDNPASVAQSVYITSTCCRVPGR